MKTRNEFRRALRPPLVWWRHRGIQPSDLLLAEYPKSGSTWLAFMLGELAFGRSIDFENQQSTVPAVGSETASTQQLSSGGRLLRTHEQYRPEYRRAIYVVRHVGDVAVSYYHWMKWLRMPQMEFKAFLPLFLQGRLDSYGPWARHVESWTSSPATTMVVRYEDLRSDTSGTLRALLDFMGEVAHDRRIVSAIENNTIQRMREKEAAARGTVFQRRSDRDHFVRKGVVGESRTWLDEQDLDLIERIAGPRLRSLGYGVRPDLVG